MDVAYDHINEEALPDSAPQNEQQRRERAQSGTGDFKKEIGDAYKAFTDSSWGSTIGGLWGTVRKQVCSNVRLHTPLKAAQPLQSTTVS